MTENLQDGLTRAGVSMTHALRKWMAVQPLTDEEQALVRLALDVNRAEQLGRLLLGPHSPTHTAPPAAAPAPALLRSA